MLRLYLLNVLYSDDKIGNSILILNFSAKLVKGWRTSDNLYFYEKKEMAQLILVPNVLSDGPWQHVLPAKIYTVLSETRFFIVENIRTARRFLKQVNRDIDINGLTFFELNKRTAVSDIPSFLRPISANENIALLSEAGCPGVADPGALVVQLAHLAGIRVVPLS